MNVAMVTAAIVFCRGWFSSSLGGDNGKTAIGVAWSQKIAMNVHRTFFEPFVDAGERSLLFAICCFFVLPLAGALCDACSI